MENTTNTTNNTNAVNAATRQLRTATIGSHTYRFNSDEKIKWDENCNLDTYVKSGTYEIVGQKKTTTDNIPGVEVGDTFSARLFVLAEKDIENYSYHVTQHIIISSSTDNNTSQANLNSNSYTRYRKGIEWTEWSKSVGVITINATEEKELDNCIDPGVYEGSISNDGKSNPDQSNPEQFILFVIRNPKGGEGGTSTPIAQFKYSINVTNGVITSKKRSGIYNSAGKLKWNAWEDIFVCEDITEKLKENSNNSNLSDLIANSYIEKNKMYVFSIATGTTGTTETDGVNIESLTIDNNSIVTNHIAKHFNDSVYCNFQVINNEIIMDCRGMWKTKLVKVTTKADPVTIPIRYTYIINLTTGDVTIESDMEMDITGLVCPDGVGVVNNNYYVSYPYAKKKYTSTGSTNEVKLDDSVYYEYEDQKASLDLITLTKADFIRPDINYKMNINTYAPIKPTEVTGDQTEFKSELLSSISDFDSKIDSGNGKIIGSSTDGYVIYINVPKFNTTIMKQNKAIDEISAHITRFFNKRGTFNSNYDSTMDEYLIFGGTKSTYQNHPTSYRWCSNNFKYNYNSIRFGYDVGYSAFLKQGVINLKLDYDRIIIEYSASYEQTQEYQDQQVPVYLTETCKYSLPADFSDLNHSRLSYSTYLLNDGKPMRLSDAIDSYWNISIKEVPGVKIYSKYIDIADTYVYKIWDENNDKNSIRYYKDYIGNVYHYGAYFGKYDDNYNYNRKSYSDIDELIVGTTYTVNSINYHFLTDESTGLNILNIGSNVLSTLNNGDRNYDCYFKYIDENTLEVDLIYSGFLNNKYTRVHNKYCNVTKANAENLSLGILYTCSSDSGVDGVYKHNVYYLKNSTSKQSTSQNRTEFPEVEGNDIPTPDDTPTIEE